MKLIDRVGVELEGAWEKEPSFPIVHDGSLDFSDDDDIPEDVYVGEARIGPFRDLAAILAAVRRRWPDHVNETCGMHVHLSFRSAIFYSWLMDPDFTQRIVDGLTMWGSRLKLPAGHVLFNRLSGNNSYCLREFHADWQADQTITVYRRHSQEGHRYTVVNYPYGIHGTLEIRVLPMFPEGPSLAQAAIREVVAITEQAIRDFARREPSVSLAVPVEAPLAEPEDYYLEATCA